MTDPAGPDDGVTVVRADAVPWEDLALVFGARGAASRCWCQRYKLVPRESFGAFPARGACRPAARADRL